MFITILPRKSRAPRDARKKLFLTWDDWNDYSFYTLFGVFYVDADGVKRDIGAVKIGFFGQQEKEKQLKIHDQYAILPENHFSVGVDDDYYVNLKDLGAAIRNKILNSLRDIAKDPELFNAAAEEDVFKVSFLRSLSETTIEGQFRRLAEGRVRLTPYNFKFTTPSHRGTNAMDLTFSVKPLSNPPTNIHALIGKNGVGKTFLIQNMIETLTKDQDQTGLFGKFETTKDDDYEDETGRFFANLICVTFSAFDQFDHPPEQKDKSIGINYSYIGLKEIQKDGKASDIISTDLLTDEFIRSLSTCKSMFKTARWKETIAMLESDTLFRDENINTLIDFKTKKELEVARATFNALSSGHKLVLLTITRLVEKLEERSLVLIDEPESHLHPPLLSSFMRALSELLMDRNAVSIIATHSPVVLQEVPRSCIWKLRRYDTEALVERLKIESFGENVGVLTQEVFGLEVTDSGFHTMLKRLVDKYASYDNVIDEMDDQIGLEAKAILRTLFYQKNNPND